MPIVPCPHCQAENDAPAGNAPFFCKSCHAIVDPTGTLRQPPTALPAAAAPPRRPSGGDFPAVATKAGSSHAGSINYSVPTGPGAGFSVGGSRIVGFALAAVAAVLVGGGLAWLAAYVVRVPLLYPFIAGWAIRRALATGSGGGTPDRGLVGGLFLAALALGTCVTARFVEYRWSADRESAFYREIYGPPGLAMTDTANVVARIAESDPDKDGLATTSGGRAFNVLDEIRHVQIARSTKTTPSDAYDIYLLATTGRAGFLGHADRVVHEGDDVRVLASAAGVHLPGFGIVLLWLVEFVIALLAAFARID
jgi:hypothetical protein